MAKDYANIKIATNTVTRVTFGHYLKTDDVPELLSPRSQVTFSQVTLTSLVKSKK